MKRAALLALSLMAVGCAPKKGSPPPRSTLVVGLDISGSFRKSGQFDDALHYAALYIYGHINALGARKRSPISTRSSSARRCTSSART